MLFWHDALDIIKLEPDRIKDRIPSKFEPRITGPAIINQMLMINSKPRNLLKVQNT
jgi:hypothetical protein